MTGLNSSIPRRVPGYDIKEGKIVNADYLSMTHPHAAGALISTVDDLAKWDEALYTDRLVKQETLARAWASFRLKDGQSVNYGYGWRVTTLEGERMLAHSGGVNGFTAYTVRIPEKKVYVAILTNRRRVSRDLDYLLNRIAAKIARIELREPVALPLPSLERYMGVYALDSTRSFRVTLENGSLFFRRGEETKQEILPLDEWTFVFKQRPAERLNFILDKDSVTGLVVRSRSGPDEEAKKQ
jgi:D-alanyl-D-alanine carboxypeptidase